MADAAEHTGDGRAGGAEAVIESAIHGGAQWELMIQEAAFQTDCLRVRGGWIVRCRGFWDSKHSGIALCFVPRLPFEPPDGGWGSS